MNQWLTHNLKGRTYHNKLPFFVNFNFHPFSPKSFREESYNVCKELHEKYGEKLFLSFSGGADSEYILKCFLELKIPIQPVIVSCPFNQEDIKPAFSYCNRHSIDPIVLEYGDDFMKHVNQKIYAKGLLSPIGIAPLLVYDHVKDIGGKVISGQGEPLPITDKDQKTDISKKLHMFEFEFYMDIYAEDQPAPFYCYNQNIFYSYMNEIDKSMDLEDAKCKLYDIASRKKTYWTEEIYSSIKKNKTMRSGYSCQFDINQIQKKMEGKIIV